MQIKLVRIFIPIFLTLLCSRIANQLDLIIAAHLGQLELAAFSVSNRAIFIDSIVALALGPVFSIFIASEKDPQIKNVENTLSVALYIGLFLSLFHLLINPILVKTIGFNDEITSFSKVALFWIALNIPLRFMIFIGNVTLHASGLGRYAVAVNIFELLSRLCCYYLLIIFPFELRFKGLILSMFISSLIALFLNLYFQKMIFGINFRNLLSPIKKWSWKIFYQARYELLRLSSERGAICLTFAFFSVLSPSVLILNAYVCILEFQMFISIISVAFLRSLSIYYAKHNINKFGFKYFLFIALIVSTALYFFGFQIGSRIYNLETASLDWWKIFILFLCISLPIQVFDIAISARLQSQKKFKITAIAGIIFDIFIRLPLAFIGVYLSNPWVACSSILIKPLFNIGALLSLNSKLKNIPQHQEV